jgi:alkylation response protein AidB-like acyl-CoA dehydrogenase
MDRFSHLQWPFFDPPHAALSREVDSWASANLEHAHGEDADAICRKLVRDLAAQVVIDDAVQILGGLGVMRGHPVERLYREVRALRIYEGATEVQKMIIARELLK